MKCVKRQKKKHQPKLIPLIKQKINSKKNISSWYMKFMDWSRKYVSVTLREEYSFQDQQRWCFFSLKFIYIQQNIFETLSTNFWTKIPAQKALEKPSMLVWHGQNCDRSQIKTKRVGAWPLCFFLMVTYIFDVFNFSFAKSWRKKIFFWWCHTNMHGTNLRSSPPLHTGMHAKCIPVEWNRLTVLKSILPW